MSAMSLCRKYSQTCIKRSPLRQKWPYKAGDLIKKLHFKWNFLWQDKQDKKRWPFNTGDCLVKVTTWAGLTVHGYCIVINNNARVGLLFYNDLMGWFHCESYIAEVKMWTQNWKFICQWTTQPLPHPRLGTLRMSCKLIIMHNNNSWKAGILKQIIYLLL